jgi:hypothetical protein
MKRRGIAGVVTTLAALCALLLAASAEARKAPRSFFGVVPQAPIGTADLNRMGQGKVGTLRFEIFWAGANPAPGDFEFGAVDQIVADAARNNVDLLPFIYSTPQWVARLDGNNCSAERCLPFAPEGNQSRDAWKAFLRELVGRYGPNGDFWSLNPNLPENPIRAWQIWNEQNSPSFYRPKPNVGRYAKLLEASDKAIGSVDAKADVVMGGMFGTPLQGRKPAIAAWEFIERLYDIRGARKSFDAIAPHPYASSMKKVRAQMELIRNEIKKARDRGVKLYITELGWASGGPAHPLNKGTQGQAERLREAFNFFLAKRRAWNVETVTWYSWRDNPGGGGLCEWCPRSGLLREDLSEKPAWRAFVKYTGGS